MIGLLLVMDLEVRLVQINELWDSIFISKSQRTHEHVV